MNDLETLDRLGPSASEPGPAALDAARARLDAAMAAPAPAVRRTRRLPLLVAASVVAAAGAGIAVAPALLKSDDSIALAAVDPLTFPVTPTWLPEGLGEPIFSKDTSALQFARYGAQGADTLTVLVTDTWDQWEERDNERPIDIGGQDGIVFERDPGDVVIAWEQADGDLVGVVGRGQFADEGTVEKVAESVRDRGQAVDLFLTVAPEGWRVMAYQSDHHVSYGERGELAVTLLDGQKGGPDFGATGVRDISVEGRPGWIGSQIDADGDRTGWIVVSTAPDGRVFSLQAPTSLTEAQVIEVAAGVRHR